MQSTSSRAPAPKLISSVPGHKVRGETRFQVGHQGVASRRRWHSNQEENQERASHVTSAGECWAGWGTENRSVGNGEPSVFPEWVQPANVWGN